MTPFEKIIWVRTVENITVAQKMILTTIASHLGNNDYCFVSMTTLQKECCIKGRTNISNNLNFLIENNFIIKKPPSEEFNSNQYQINFEKIIADYKKNEGSNEALLVVQHYQQESEAQLVTLRYYPSNEALLPRSRSVTRVVTERYPKRNIKENKRNIKETNNTRAREISVNNPSQNVIDDHFVDANKMINEDEVGDLNIWEMLNEPLP